MIYYVGNIPYDSNCLVHHGIKGQEWGKRRFQYEDGSVTPEGAERYYEYDGKLKAGEKPNAYEKQLDRKMNRSLGKAQKFQNKENLSNRQRKKMNDNMEKYNQLSKEKKEYENMSKNQKRAKNAQVHGRRIAAAALAVGGALTLAAAARWVQAGIAGAATYDQHNATYYKAIDIARNMESVIGKTAAVGGAGAAYLIGDKAIRSYKQKKKNKTGGAR